jgi:lipopolysaccharide biosynthesis glycosyltransferase
MEVLEIALGADAAFAMPLAVALASIARLASIPTRVWAVHADMPAELRRRVAAGVADTQLSIEWIDGSSVPALRDVPISAKHSRATFFRLALAELLPAETRRVVYLDCDVVASDDLAPLRDVELGGGLVGAVRDVGVPWVATSRGLPHWRELGIEPTTPYYNSGVLVIDLDGWREQRIGPRIVDYLSEHGSIYFADQDAINVVLAGCVHDLEPRWNQHPFLFRPDGLGNVVFPPEQVQRACEEPAIVHYLTRDKPWLPGCTHPMADRWFAVLDGTAWSGWRPEGPGVAARGWDRVKSSARVLIQGR